MPAPGVTIKEIDLSTRIPNFEGIYGVMVIDSERGPTDKPVLVANETQLLREFTLDETVKIGFSSGYFEALMFLQRSNKLWVKRVAGTGALAGGVTVSDGTTVTANAVLATGEADPSGHTPVADEAMLIHANSVGIWSGDAGTSGVGFKLHNERAVEDIDSSSDLLAALITLNVTAQDWVDDEAVTVRPNGAGVLPTALVQGTTYYVVYVDGADISLSTTLGGGSIVADVVTGASGSFFMEAVNKVDEPDSFKLEVFKYTDQVNPVETFFLSRDTAKKDGFGKNIYVENRMESSIFLGINDNTLVADTVLPKSQPNIIFLDGGVDGAAATSGQYQLAVDEFSSKETYPITVLMDGGVDFLSYKNYLLTLAEGRGDCVTYLGNPQSIETATTYLTDIIDWKKTLNTSSYGALFTPSCKVYDKYNDRDLFIGTSGFAGSALAFTAFNFEAWYAPAGDTRGAINSSDVNIRFTQSDMDLLYDNYINPIRFHPTKGVAIWGQKTLINRPTALDRLSTRLMITIIQPEIARLLESFLFEFNDDSTRGIVTNKIEAYLEGVKARRGLFDFRVVVDDTNNTDEDIDNHILNVDVYIKPNQVTEFINFTTIITNRGTSFETASNAI